MEPQDDFGSLYRGARGMDRDAQDELVRRYWGELGRFLDHNAGPAVKQRTDASFAL